MNRPRPSELPALRRPDPGGKPARIGSTAPATAARSPRPARRKNGAAPPPHWRHPALESAGPALRAAAAPARELGQGTRPGPRLVTVHRPVRPGRPDGAARRPSRCKRASLTRSRRGRPPIPPHCGSQKPWPGLDLLEDDSTPAIRSWIERRRAAPGFRWRGPDLAAADAARRRHPARPARRPAAHRALVSRPWPPPRGHRRRHHGRAGSAARHQLDGRQLRQAALVLVILTLPSCPVGLDAGSEAPTRNWPPARTAPAAPRRCRAGRLSPGRRWADCPMKAGKLGRYQKRRSSQKKSRWPPHAGVASGTFHNDNTRRPGPRWRS